MNTFFNFLAKPALVAATFFLFSVVTTIAQPGSGGPRPSDVPEEPAAGVPIDGGASLLLAAGGAYGLKKINDFRKGKKQEPEA